MSQPQEAGAGPDPFRTLYLGHHEAVRSVLWRLGARDELDDLVQDVFVRVCGTWEQFRGDASPRTWIVRIAINVAKDHFKKRRLELADDAAVATARVDPAPARDLVATDAIERTLDDLGDDARSVFVLCMVEEYSMSEAAAILGIPEGTVKSRLFHAKREVRARLQHEGYAR